MELLEFLSFQSRSAFVYGCTGMIAIVSPPVTEAILLAAPSVVPVAEKYTTNVFLIHIYVF